MARGIRIQYPGALYHVMARGNRRERIFHDDTGRRLFLQTLAEACQRTGWRVHAWVLMRNHYHLMLENPSSCRRFKPYPLNFCLRPACRAIYMEIVVDMKYNIGHAGFGEGPISKNKRLTALFHPRLRPPLFYKANAPATPERLHQLD